MVSVATVMAEKEEEYCRYSVVKLDADVIPLVKAAAALDRQTVQDWLSDMANAMASKRANQKPVKRKPPRPPKS